MEHFMSERNFYLLLIQMISEILKKLSGATDIYNSDIIRFDAFFRTDQYIEK